MPLRSIRNEGIPHSANSHEYAAIRVSPTDQGNSHSTGQAFTNGAPEPMKRDVSVFGTASVAAHFHDSGIEARDGFDEVTLFAHDISDVFVDAWNFVGSG